MGLDCLLISTNQVVTPYPVYPLGIAHLAGALESAGHKTMFYDILAEGGTDNLKKILTETDPGLVALSIRNLDTVDSTAPHTYVEAVVETMTLVRDLSAAPVVLGGPAFSILPEELLEYFGGDYGIVGEGEILLPWLADRIEQGALPEERIFRGQASKDPWKPVKYDNKIADFYIGWGGMLNVQTKRGCPFKCGYCSYPSLEGNKYRFRDPQEVASDVIRAANDFGAKFIFFTDSVFNDATGHFLEVAEALIKAGNKTPWCAYFRPQGLHREDMKILIRSGLSEMELGTDAACDKTLAGLDKGFSFEDVIKTNELARDLGVPCAHFIIFGGPDEDKSTLAEGLDNIDSLGGSVVFAFPGIRILPGTSIFKRAVSEGVIKEDQPMREPVFYFSPKITSSDIDERLRNAWAKRFDRIYPASHMDDRIKYLHQKGHVGPLWDLLLSRKKQ